MLPAILAVGIYEVELVFFAGIARTRAPTILCCLESFVLSTSASPFLVGATIDCHSAVNNANARLQSCVRTTDGDT